MQLNGLKTALFATLILVVAGAAALAQGQGQSQGQGQGQTQGQAQAGQPPAGRGQGAPLENLQVLPKDMTRQQVTQLMRTFTAALGGVECTHCHVGTQQERAKDDNPKKAIARKMIQMTAAINTDLLKGVGDPAPEGTTKVTCFTCHRGALKPLTAPPSGGGGGH